MVQQARQSQRLLQDTPVSLLYKSNLSAVDIASRILPLTQSFIPSKQTLL